MEHVDEYSDAMLTAMDLVWGEGFMAPGGPGNVSQMLRGLETRGRHLLDVGCLAMSVMEDVVVLLPSQLPAPTSGESNVI